MSASELPSPRFAPASVDASHQIALEIRRYLEREGLRLLASSHLIRVGRGRAGGIFVARTPSEGMSRNVTESISMMLATETVSLGELLDARMFLEVPLAGLAAANATEETAAALQAAIDEAAEHKPGTPPFNDADKRFHQILAEAAGNELLLAFTGWILEVLQPQLIAKISPRVDGAEILRQHRDIQRAVRRRQSAGAERAMRAHIAYLMDIQRDA